MKTLLIDNYDSFTFNLFQYLAEVNGVPPVVVRNDTAPWEELRELEFDNIVISPGPGRPEVDRDFGICRRAILEASVPLLGVCLGHQGLCHLFGGTVDYAQVVMHGRPSQVHHAGIDVFAGIPSPFRAIRYHSLHVPALSDELEALAWTEDGILMGVRHRSRPIRGVQFHPESICTEFGHRLLENFRALTTEHQRLHPPRRRCTDHGRPRLPTARYDIVPAPGGSDASAERGRLHGKRLVVHHRRIPQRLDAERVFMNLFADSSPAFWLDSALVRGFSRFSYMGDASGPHAEFVTYDLPSRKVTVVHRGRVTTHAESIFDYLQRALAERRVDTEGLPFDFNCGYAGYLGYELKADCGASGAHRSPTADAGFVFADRLIAFDHEEGVTYLVCVDDEEHEARAMEWLDATSERLPDLEPAPPWSRVLRPRSVAQTLRHPPHRYLELIAQCKGEIRRGESYEICLTNMITNHVRIDPLNTYRALRSRNPAPYATYLNFPGVAVLSSSPERFITVDPHGVVDAKPIKGTRRRGRTVREDEALYEDLHTNEKDRSENLMIVDLLRNDLGTVCNVGSVHVSNIFTVESYATVHQLVSSIRGRLRRGISAVQAVRAAFPAGSMTGAPKKRTMEIIDRLEAGPRGIYSGSIGFFGLNGSADLSVVIRTIVATPADVTVGVGGAIVDLSDPGDELEEMLLKSRALVQSLSETAVYNTPARVEYDGSSSPTTQLA
jgi:para-aminobenzoate synthetase